MRTGGRNSLEEGRQGAQEWCVAFGVQFALLMMPSAVVTLLFRVAVGTGSASEAGQTIYGLAMVLAFFVGARLVGICRRYAEDRVRTRMQLRDSQSLSRLEARLVRQV